MKKNKLIAGLLSLTLLLSTSSMSGYAAQEVPADDGGLYIQSKLSADQADSYAKEHASSFVNSMINADEKFSYLIDSDISLGSPFSIDNEDTNSSIYPILCDGEIAFTFFVYFDDVADQYVGYMSTEYVDDLNSLKGATTQNTPAHLYFEEQDFKAEILNATQRRALGNDVVDVYSSTPIDMDSLENSVRSTRATTSKYIALSRTETQADQTWCSAFAGAAIVRTRKSNSLSAKTIMKYFYPKATDTDLKAKSISHSNLMDYVESEYDISTSYSSSTLSTSSVKKQIDNDRPIYLSCDGSDTYKKAKHALVLRGYDSTNYSVWNPWNKDYAVMSISTKTLPVSGGSFVWNATIYNW